MTRCPHHRVPALIALLLLLLAGGAAAQAGSRLSVRVGENGRAVVLSEGLLRDAVLRDALDSGLPLRFRLRVELWEKRLFDRLVDAQEIHLALVQDPLDHSYLLDDRRVGQRFESLALVEDAVARALRPALRPGERRGRFYYLAELEVETLSLSDLEELRRWLRGSVGPAVEGRTSPERALRSGLERVLIRVIGLPTRRYEARSATFSVP